MPIDFSGLPDRTAGLDLSGLPDKGHTPTPPQVAPAPQAKEPDLLDKLGMAGGLSGLLKTAKDVFTGAPGAREGFASGAGEAAQAVAPTAIRMGSGVLGAEGMLPGALIAGGGEGLAQMFEKGTIDPRQLDKARIAVATGTGAIPFGKIAQEGRVATSALRGGALAGGGEGAREYMAGEHLDPQAVGTAAGMGAVGAGGASKLATMFGASPKLKGAVEGEAAATPRMSSGQQESALRRQVNGGTGKGLPSGSREFDLGPISSPGIGVEQRPPAPVPASGAPQMGMPAEANSRVQKTMKAEQAAAAKTTEQQRIDETIAELGLEAKTPVVSEAASGQKSMKIPYGAPPEAQTSETARPAPTKKPSELFKALKARAAEHQAELDTQPGWVNSEADRLAGQGQPVGASRPIEEAFTGLPVADESSLAKFFKSKAGAAGENYGQAKAAEKAGQISSADEAYNALARERTALGQETAPRTPTGTTQDLSALTENPNAIPVPTAESGGDWIQQQTDLVDAAAQESTLRDRLLNLAKSEQGSVQLSDLTSDRAKRLLGAGAGAAIGAPIGSSAYGPDDDFGALKGALAGGLVGYNAGRGMNNLVNYRNSMLLASPSPVSKNVLGDMGGMVGETLKQAITPGQGGYAKDLFKNLPFISPRQYGRDYLQELLHPESAGATSSMRDVVGEALDKPMELIYRPFSASNVAVRKAMERAGAPQRVIEEASGISTPETPFFRSWLGMQQHAPARYLFPFQKIASNVAEGARNIPGVSLMAGNPNDKWQRTAMGGLQTALGAGSELYDEAQAAEGNPTSNWTKGVRPNLLGPKYIAPFAVGQALTAALNQGPANAIEGLVSMVPGARATVPQRFPNEDADAYIKRVLSGPISQMVPGFLKPDPGSVR